MPRGMPFLVFFSWVASLALARADEYSVEIKLPSAVQYTSPGRELKIPILVSDQAGRGVAGLGLALAASAGEFANLTDLGQGNYQATYRMPPGRHPQAVILAVKPAGALPAWKVLILQSKTTLPVNTSKPHVMVTLKLGGRKYGPHRTDAEGRVKIPVDVLPGEVLAQAEAVDEFGNRTTRRVTIPVPPSCRLLGMAEKTNLVADGNDRSDVFLIVINRDGTPSEDAAFVAYRKVGQVSRAMKIMPGLYRLRYTAPVTLDPPQAKLTLALNDAPKQSRQTLAFIFAAGKPARLSAEVKPSRLFADGKSTAIMTMAVTDVAGHPVSGYMPQLVCSAGQVGPVSDSGGGSFQVSLVAPDKPVGKVTCIASLKTDDFPSVRAEAMLEVIPLVPAEIKAECDTNQLLADGRSQVKIDILVRDQRGNPLDEVAIQTRAATGSFGKVAPGTEGRYRVIYTAPQARTDSRVRLSIEAGEEEGVVTEHLMIELRAPPPPPRPVPWFNLGPWAGVTTNFGRMVYAAFTLEGILRLPFGGRHFHLVLEGGYRFGQQTGESSVTGESLRTRVEYLPVHLSILYKLWPEDDFTPFAGIGGGAEFVQWSLENGDAAREQRNLTLVGSVAYLGGELRLGPGAFFVQLRYLYAFMKDRAAVEQQSGDGGSRVIGNIGGLEVGGGYRLSF